MSAPRQTTDMGSRAWIELAGLAAIWGASFLSIKLALDEVPVVTLVAHRVGWAMLVLWGIVALRRLPLPRGARIWGALAVMGLLNNVLPFTLMAWGQQHIETGLTSILNAATAIFGVLVAAAVFADERLSLRRAAGVALGFAGVATAIGREALVAFDIRSAAQLAVIAGTLGYAAAGAWGRAQLSGLHPLVAAAGMLTAASLVMTPLALAVDGPPDLALAPVTWAAIAWFALVGTALAYLLYYRVLALAGAGNLLLVTLMIPPVAIVLGALVLDEALGPGAFAGFGLLAAGLLLLDGRVTRRRPGNRRPPR